MGNITKRQRFIELCLSGEDAQTAIRLAGYKNPDNAYIQLLKDDTVVQLLSAGDDKEDGEQISFFEGGTSLTKRDVSDSHTAPPNNDETTEPHGLTVHSKTKKSNKPKTTTKPNPTQPIKAVTESDAPPKHQAIADRGEIAAFWSSIMRCDSERTVDRLKASELCSKLLGLFDGDDKADVIITLDGAVKKYGK